MGYSSWRSVTAEKQDLINRWQGSAGRLSRPDELLVGAVSDVGFTDKTTVIHNITNLMREAPVVTWPFAERVEKW